jgi:hypothetical protein
MSVPTVYDRLRSASNRSLPSSPARAARTTLPTSHHAEDTPTSSAAANASASGAGMSSVVGAFAEPSTAASAHSRPRDSYPDHPEQEQKAS